MSTAAEFLLTWVAYLTVAAAVYAATLLGMDALLQARVAHHRHRAALIRINNEAALAVQRIGAAFLVARQLIGDDATESRGGHR
ncbi:hypothetical protein [Mycobacterium sp. Aquia_213]|uniref:hypothetical protein n=1 Tax=Mycobacterium sp. Aquia_213 TaxID=2991728 RepID=UPI002270D66C|nr:hypothetical protein [Mycobacterium sp. Aquia_213]WAC90221.1 hypothetical protein LMQ14_20140 [Mycobacterium sp. Aquia_213]